MRFVSAALLLAAILKSSEAFVHILFGPEVIDLYDDNFIPATEEYHHMLVVFYQPHNTASQMFAPIFSEASREIKKMGIPVHFGKVNDSENPDLAELYRINHTPTLLWFEHGDRYRFTGHMNKASEIVEWIEKTHHIKADHKEI